MKDYDEAADENHNNREKNRNCFSNQSLLDSHSWSVDELNNFMQDAYDYFSQGGYIFKANNAD